MIDFFLRLTRLFIDFSSLVFSTICVFVLADEIPGWVASISKEIDPSSQLLKSSSRRFEEGNIDKIQSNRITDLSVYQINLNIIRLIADLQHCQCSSVLRSVLLVTNHALVIRLSVIVNPFIRCECPSCVKRSFSKRINQGEMGQASFSVEDGEASTKTSGSQKIRISRKKCSSDIHQLKFQALSLYLSWREWSWWMEINKSWSTRGADGNVMICCIVRVAPNRFTRTTIFFAIASNRNRRRKP